VCLLVQELTGCAALCTQTAAAGGLILHFVSSELMRSPLCSNIYTSRDDMDKSPSAPLNLVAARGRKFRAREKRSARTDFGG